jgi:large subunit ribosomal protein L5
MAKKDEEGAPEGAEKPKKKGGDAGAEAKAEAGGAGAAPPAEAKPKKGGEGKGGKDKGGKDKGGKGKGKAADVAQAYKRTELPRLRRIYEAEVRKKMTDEFGYKNPMEIPRLVKVTLNMGLGKAVANPKIVETAVDEMRAIAGQAPVVCKAKKDIATFKLRKGLKIGVMVTLRREWMWEFLDRFINIALPRVRDFRGISPKSFDGRGNFSTGIKEQIIFPEIDYDAIDVVKGLNVTVVTTAGTDAEGRALLKYLGMPFRQASATAAQGAQA